MSEQKEKKPMEQTFWKPGNIVKLNEPYHPGHPDRNVIRAVIGTGMQQYSEWKGFTHGIIVQSYAHDHKGVSHVSLHLYDPERCVIYTENFAHGIPTYVDFHVSELTPWKDAEVTGYKVMGGEEDE